MRIRACELWVLLCVLSIGVPGCLDRELAPVNPCLVSGVQESIESDKIDKIDLLFMVDNSGSMAEEQRKLAEQFPRLITILTTGDTNPDDGIQLDSDFPAVTDLHLGVVTSDMGLPTVDRFSGQGGCGPGVGRPLGDDGRLLSDVRQVTDPDDNVVIDKSHCPANLPSFLRFRVDDDAGTDAILGQAESTASDFGCLATQGTGGCGIEQQLEAVLKALAPSNLRIDSRSGDSEPVRFLDAQGNLAATGHGDGANAGFLRRGPDALLSVIMVTDEEDCSAHSFSHLRADPPAHVLQHPLCSQAPDEADLRCACANQNLFSPQRYIRGLKALRPDHPDLVMFAAVAGVPDELTGPEQRDAFGDDADAYFDSILQAGSMQARLNEAGDNLASSCRAPDADEDGTFDAEAKPPRRIVEVAKGFGDRGVVQSICQEHFGGALDEIIDVLVDILAVCLPRDLEPNVDGMVGCEAIWELPRPEQAASADTPTRCDDLPFLSPPPPDRAQQTEDGKARCVVRQLPVLAETGNKSAPTEDPARPLQTAGWFYDDFSAEVKESCADRFDSAQRVLFTEHAQPPSGVVVKLECIQEVQSLSDVSTSPGMPAIGSPCEPGAAPDPAEAERRVDCDGDGQPDLPDRCAQCSDGELDTSLFCHPQVSACVLRCESNGDCPSAWVCDTRPETQTAARLETGGEAGICVNPTCGD